MPATEKRGPRVGDAKSLWNFTPSPGWTKEEVGILRLCLMKFGIGQWVKILNTGLLPGKVIQQLNGQTQRLLGQQSLAMYTGLRVDIDRIREENEGRTEVTRKGGLIIYEGAPPTKETKQRWKRESQKKYGLSQEDLASVEQQLGVIAQQYKEEKEAQAQSNAQFKVEKELLDSDAGAMDRQGRLDLLAKLRAKLLELVEVLKKAETVKHSDGTGSRQEAAKKLAPEASHKNDPDEMEIDEPPQTGDSRAAAANPRDVPVAQSNKSHSENSDEGKKLLETCRLNSVQPQISKPGSQKSAGPKRKRKTNLSAKDGNSKRKGRRKSEKNLNDAQDDHDDDDGIFSAAKAAVEADMQTITSMGYSRRHAKEALEESNFNVEAAIEWLIINCS